MRAAVMAGDGFGLDRSFFESSSRPSIFKRVEKIIGVNILYFLL
jgi:hypothetical protein